MSVVTYTYNRQQQRTGMTDQNGTVHAFVYDQLGRQTADKVTMLGTGVNGAVRRIEQSYNARSLLEKVTSYDAATGGNVVNQVQNVYNDFNQLATQYQEHAGAVNTSSSAGVQYAYADGSANTIRRTQIIYPDNTYLEYRYGNSGDPADRLSRIEILNSGGTDDICQYTYLGLNTFVKADYLLSSIRWDLATGSGANPYTGLDAFGRVIDCLWQQYSGPTTLVELLYGYNFDSSRQWRQDAVAGSGFDELYAYDPLQRLVDMERGTLNGAHDAISSATLGQDWALDPTGNWNAFNITVTGALEQTRDSNPLNQITGIAETSGTQWATPAYNAAGNMTTMPRPSALNSTYTATYDAWHRLVLLNDGTSDVGAYAYDGMNRRVKKTVGSAVRHFYFSDQWQVVEERVGTASVPNKQYYWGLRYVDDLVMRLRDPSGGGLSQLHYVMQDANWNVVAIYNLIAASLDERYAYTPYGVVEFLTPSFGSRSASLYDWTYLFTGRERDTESGLQINRNRYLHPYLGCWVTMDPMLYAAGDVNLYRYVSNGPLSRLDPLGTFDIRDYLRPGTFEISIPLGFLPCDGVVTLTVKNEGGCHVLEVGVGISCSVKERVIRKLGQIPYVGPMIVSYASWIPDISLQTWGEGVGRVCCNCSDFCEISINGALTVGNGRRGGGTRNTGFTFGIVGEANGILNFCEGTLRLDGTLVGSVGFNAHIFGGEIAYNRDFEWSGTIVGPPDRDPVIEFGGAAEFLQWAEPCR